MENGTQSDVLNKIAIRPWVFRTVEKMSAAGKADVKTWDRFWLQTYQELGGKSETSGSKRCPRAAAFGLWTLGRLRGSGRDPRAWTLDQVNHDLGSNAAYAVIAADLLAKDATISQGLLWKMVRTTYEQHTRREPATLEQGEMKIVLALFRAHQRVAPVAR